MTTWIIIGLRNLVKNKRRSIVTILAIALGFAAVNLFGGFTNYMYSANRDGSIYSSYLGHMAIFRKGARDSRRMDPEKNLLSAEEVDIIQKTCEGIPGIILQSPQLQVTGLLSNGKVSTIFVAQGLVPSVMDVFSKQTKLNILTGFEGQAMKDDDMYGVALSKGVAQMLELKVGSDAVAMANTADGQMNALDMKVVQVFEAPTNMMNDRMIRVPLKFAQSLYDTQGAYLVVVLLARTEDTDIVRAQLEAAFAQKGVAFDIKTWKELSDWYVKVKDMFDIIFLFLFTIVFVIVTMSVINTMSIAVLERTREIGTLRALGLKRRGVITLFAIESCLLGLGGIVCGILLSLGGWSWVRYAHITWVPPGIASRVPLQVDFSLDFFVYSTVFLMLLCLIASLLPTRRAARQNVVDSLGHV